MADDDVTIIWAYSDMPQPSLGAPTLYDFYLDPSLEAWATLEDDDDDGFGWQTYFSRKSFRQRMTRTSQSSEVKIRGQKPPQKKNKKNKKKKKKSRAKKKLEITSEEEYVPPTKTPFTLQDYIPKGLFGSDSSDDEPAEEEVAQCCMVSWADECEELNAKLADNIQEVHQVTLQSGRQLPSPESARKWKEKETIPRGSSSLANAKKQSKKEQSH